MATNEYGLDVNYFKRWMKRMVRDLDRYTPEEAFTELTRMTMVAADQAGHEVEMKVKHGDSKQEAK